MRWFRRGRRARSGGRAAADSNDRGAAADANGRRRTADQFDIDARDGFDICATCGRELDGDPDEDPTGGAGMPICGECARERDFFVMDIADGELDGRLG